jgi:hypothetical protein
LYLVIKSASQSLELLSNNYEALQFDCSAAGECHCACQHG